jgi:hypothetical protein
VIPQAVCSRHGLAIGANLVWLVKILMVLCFPISYPVGKVHIHYLVPDCNGKISETWHRCILMYHIWLQILDYLLGHNDSALFRRAQLKALVSIHGKEVSSMKKTETVCKMEVMLWMSVACKFWLSEICRSYVCQTSGMMATMWKVLGCVTSGWKRRWSYAWWDYHHPRGFGPDRKGLDLIE